MYSNISEITSSSYDYVLSTQVIEHVHNPGQYLSEINRVLKNNGKLIISIPNIMTPETMISHLYKTLEKGLHEESISILGNYDKRGDHIMAWDALHFTRLLATVGFRFVSVTYSEGLRFPSGRRHWRISNRRMQHFSYTMIFKFEKVKECQIAISS